MKWKDGFYMDNEAPDNAVLITDELYEELLSGQSKGKQIKSTTNRLPYLEDAKMMGTETNQIKVQLLYKWFVWYDNQVSQAQRAERTNTLWTASYEEKEYLTLAELDAEANIKQEELRVLSVAK